MSVRRLEDVLVFRQVMPLASHSPGLLRRRKFHSTFKHWIQCIRDFGAPYFYSGEANEEFHKVACKVCRHITSDFSRWLTGVQQTSII